MPTANMEMQCAIKNDVTEVIFSNSDFIMFSLNYSVFVILFSLFSFAAPFPASFLLCAANWKYSDGLSKQHCRGLCRPNCCQAGVNGTLL